MFALRDVLSYSLTPLSEYVQVTSNCFFLGKRKANVRNIICIINYKAVYMSCSYTHRFIQIYSARYADIRDISYKNIILVKKLREY